MLDDRRIQEAQNHTDPTDQDPDSDPDPQHWVPYSLSVFVMIRSAVRQCLASGSGDKTVRFWDLTTETPLHECKATNPFSRLIRINLLLLYFKYVIHIVNISLSVPQLGSFAAYLFSRVLYGQFMV